MATLDEQVAFSREAAAVMHSPYWLGRRVESFDEQLRIDDEMENQKSTLSKALGSAESYADLTGEAKEIYDAAKAKLTGSS